MTKRSAAVLVADARELVRRAGTSDSPLYGDLVSCVLDLANALDLELVGREERSAPADAGRRNDGR